MRKTRRNSLHWIGAVAVIGFKVRCVEGRIIAVHRGGDGILPVLILGIGIHNVLDQKNGSVTQMFDGV